MMKHGASYATVVVSLLALASATAGAAAEAKAEYLGFEDRQYIPFVASDIGGAPAEASVSHSYVPHVSGAQTIQGFQGISQYDTAAIARNFIPPDTIGAVGKTQYVTILNGGYAVYDKATGSRTSFSSDLDFWAAAGQTGTQGDSRIMYNKAANRWIATSFGDKVSDIQIAVSDTSDALGSWKSTKFTGYAGLGFGGVADYPTLALDTNAIYIGTNNFAASVMDGPQNFRGTTLNVIPLASVFGAGAPTTAGLKQFNTPYSSTTGGAERGFAIQGVNSQTATTTGHIVAASLFRDDVVRYDINNAGTPGATRTATSYVGTADYAPQGAGRQPNAVPDVLVPPLAMDDPLNNDRVVDTLDQRIGSSVYEVDGRIYAVYTVTELGSDFTSVRYDVIDAATGELLDEGHIGDNSHDYYEGSLAVNRYGQVLIGYNRSGSGADGKISFLAQAFSTNLDGALTARGGEQLLKVSLVDDYHNGSLDGQVAKGRQRWGDYSAVSLDPENDRTFWAIGQYAREYNDAAGGHPLGTGGSRWSTWISEINVGTNVPEPATWALMISGFGFVGSALRRRRSGFATA